MKLKWAWSAALAACALLLFARLGAVPVTSPHEARVIGPARTMVRSGDYLVPRFNGSPRLRKPPLPYWAVVLSGLLAGSFERWAVRLPAAGCGLFTAAVVLALVRSRWGTAYGCIAALSVVTTFIFLLAARLAAVDIFLTAFTTAALAGWFSLHAGPRRGHASALTIATWAALALAVLAKGPAILPSALLPLILWPIMSPSRVVLSRKHLIGLLVLLGIALPWPIAVALREPEAVRVWLNEVATRSDPEVHSLRPAYYYLVRLPVVLFPWTWPAVGGVFVFALPGHRVPAAGGTERRPWRALRRAIADQPLTAYALLWFVGGVLCWSLIGQKKAEYLLPLIPASAILTTATWRYWMGRYDRLLCRLGIAGQAGVHLATVAVAVYFLICRPAWWPWCAAIAVLQVPAVWLLVRGAARCGMGRAAGASLAAFFLTALIIVAVLMPLGSRDFHSHALAHRTRALLKAGDRVLFYRMFSAAFVYAVDAPRAIEMVTAWSEVPTGAGHATYVVVEEEEWHGAPAEVRAAYREVAREENFGAKGVEGVHLDREGECVLLLTNRPRAASSRPE